MTARSQGLRQVAGFGLFSLVMVGILAGLGVWQLQRRVEKHALIRMLDERLAAAAVALPGEAQWPGLSQARDEFRRVTFRATFGGKPDARVFSSGSGVRADITTAGVWVFEPAQVAGGGEVVVNRGFVPDGQQGRISPPPPGEVRLTGYIRYPEHAGMLTPQADQAKRLWFLRDPKGMANALGWGTVAPFYLDLEAPAPANGLPKPGPLVVHLKDNHMQYAITWFGLAAAVAIAFAVWLSRALKEQAGPSEGAPESE